MWGRYPFNVTCLNMLTRKAKARNDEPIDENTPRPKFTEEEQVQHAIHVNNRKIW